MTSPWRYKKKVKIYKYRAFGDNERHVIDYGTGIQKNSLLSRDLGSSSEVNIMFAKPQLNVDDVQYRYTHL